jgi:RHS repeat-associated protein
MLNQVISKETSNTIASYTYDYMGRRSSSTDSLGNTIYYHYDGWNVVAESNSSGQITANYYYDNNGQIMSMKKNGNYYYYQFNAHGDVVSLTDESGSVVNTYKYDPWGKLLSSSETISNPYRYASYRYDTDTGLYYLRARYYSPEIYRFMNKDLYAGDLRTPKTLNSYVYVMDNPVNLIDPTGLLWSEISNGFNLISAGAGFVTVGSAISGNVEISAVSTGVGIVASGFSAFSTYMAESTGEITSSQANVSYGLAASSFFIGLGAGTGNPYAVGLGITSLNFSIGSLFYGWFTPTNSRAYGCIR